MNDDSAAQAPQIPNGFQRARWRGTLEPQPGGECGVSFDLADGSVVRLVLSADDARSVRETLAPEYWKSSSARSS